MKYREIWQAARAVHAMLAVEHPFLFSLDSPVPFRIGFSEDIKARYPEIPWRVIHRLMWWLTNRRAYLLACAEGANRWGFEGNDGTVTAKQEAYAKKRFAWRDSTAKDKWHLQIAAE